MKAFIIQIIILLVVCSCSSFSKVKRKYGKKSKETISVPFVKTIPPDSTLLQVKIKDLIPGYTIRNTGVRSSIFLNVDSSGTSLNAQAECEPIYIKETIPVEVERLVFNEADFSGYIAKSEVAKLVKEARKIGVLEGKAGKKNFFEQLEDTGIKIIFLILIFIACGYAIKKILERKIF